jgi:hypothetical protein
MQREVGNITIVFRGLSGNEPLLPVAGLVPPPTSSLHTPTSAKKGVDGRAEPGQGGLSVVPGELRTTGSYSPDSPAIRPMGRSLRSGGALVPRLQSTE